MHETLDVWLQGQFAGQLHRGEGGLVEFVYDASYAANPATTPLSLSMPKAALGHGPRVAQPWVENLLPEEQATRQAWARHFGETRTDAFTLLRHMGIDAPGAVQVVEQGRVPSNVGEYRELSQADIADRLRSIQGAGRAWTPGAGEGSRFSLAGQQAKFALTKVGDVWVEPFGGHASTHIVKPGMQGASGTGFDDQATEFATMRAAKHLGLPVASVAIESFGGVPAFTAKRYDRATGSAGEVLRVHQEDLCQALGIPAAQKYQSDGGPGVAQVAEAIRGGSSKPGEDVESFAKVLAFNYLVAGIDGHGKNYSFLMAGSAVRLAPFYDLISAHGIWEPERVAFDARMAMKYGREYRLRKIDGRNLVRTADDLGMDRAAFLDIVTSVAKGLPEAMSLALEELPELQVSARVRELPEAVAGAGEAIERSLHATDLDVSGESYSPRSARAVGAQPSFGRAVGAGDVWVPGHHEGGKWVSGHYRSRPRSR